MSGMLVCFQYIAIYAGYRVHVSTYIPGRRMYQVDISFARGGGGVVREVCPSFPSMLCRLVSWNAVQ